jgi:deoxyadenosine/deoxycytidine kinase
MDYIFTIFFVICIILILIDFSIFFRKKPKIIILTGAVGSGKTTFGEMFEKYLQQQGYKVYRPTEISLEYPRELSLFYETKNALFIQKVLVDAYKKRTKKINRLSNFDNVIKHFLTFYEHSWGYDFIILDRTHRDITFFTNINIENENAKKYIEEEQGKVNIENVYRVIYIKPKLELTIQRKQKRNRSWEKCNEEYLIKLYNEYEKLIGKVYPDYQWFDNSDYLCENCINLKKCEQEKKCNILKYLSYFKILSY